ncbi:glycoprotein-N-acetylgalactosamine 3-beta-galactosyltransferase 1-like isoform X2 [Palaemon carinicauda]|uniref:glycoprotein-N-acetylgalactosamine 3-beta-galactosyltransferase 1-like isoform X2 n=1 Tax=Palaemon carinicauda TaxID=392227 RepID=UPI0035B58112
MFRKKKLFTFILTAKVVFLTHHEAVPFRRSPAEDSLFGNPPRVLCLVMTAPSNHRDRARHVAATWGLNKQGDGQGRSFTDFQYQEFCPNTIFVTSSPHPNLKKVIYTEYKSYKEIWGKVLDAFRSVNASQADWVMKADDDTFIIYPRLQRLLTRFDAKKPLLLGLNLIYTFKDGKEVEYMSGGAGYLLSSPAVQMLQEARIQECQFPGATSYEDVNMGICLSALGVDFGDTRDSLGRPVFLPCRPQTFFDPDNLHHPNVAWIKSMSKYPVKFGIEHMSDRVVSFHEIRNPKDVYIMHYLTHHLRILTPSEVTAFTKSRD